MFKVINEANTSLFENIKYSQIHATPEARCRECLLDSLGGKRALPCLTR